MNTESAQVKTKRRIRLIVAGLGIFAFAAWIYIRTHPLVFNESFFGHAHCMPQVLVSLRIYAQDDGRFPAHTNGYGDALLLLAKDEPNMIRLFSGPGYDWNVLARALAAGTDVPESECGRVYVQGLTTNSSVEIAILFDKVANPGDHSHGLRRLTAKFGREVGFVDSSRQFITESQWPEFRRRQIQLLMAEGFSEEQAVALYAEAVSKP